MTPSVLTFTTHPDFCLLKCGQHLTTRNAGPNVFTKKHCSRMSSVVRSIGTLGATPAEFTRLSTRPKRSIV
jgi:hypothetical protein